ncbi:MAG: ABC transporter permease [Bacteroidia bacterium]|nr:ABC transporter permease [Bacteroidia bacterium]
MKQARLLLEGMMIALGALRKHFLRTMLTMLGISMGIFAITGIFTFVNSMQNSVTANLSALGNTVLYVHNWPWKNNSEDWYKYMGRPRVSYSDYQILKNELKNVVGVSYEATLTANNLKHRKRSVTGVEVKAVTFDYGRINSLEIGEGRYFSEIEVNSGRPVAIVGINVAKGLIGNGPYEGESIRFSGKKLRVVGVLNPIGSGLFGTSMDDRIFIPYSYASRIFDLEDRHYDKVITVRADEYENVARVESEIIGLIRRNRGLKPRVEDDFSINKQEMLMRQVEDFFKYLQIGGFFISILSVIVGGFGIGNIMYASVKERTFDIGLQKALGATNRFILFQFLFESIFLCLLGGIAGLLLLALVAIGGTYLLESLEIPLKILISTSSILVGLILSVGIGLISGFIPAIYAAKLDPVDSMRAA